MGLQLVGIRLLKVETFISKREVVMKPTLTIEIKRNSFDCNLARPQKP
jgi:hypothetical protein